MTEFAHLHVASGYSLRHGASTPQALVERAAELGQPALALTDRDALYGAVRFVRACQRSGVAPILGVDLAVRATASPRSTGSGAPPVRTPVRGGAEVDPRHPRVTVLALGANSTSTARSELSGGSSAESAESAESRGDWLLVGVGPGCAGWSRRPISEPSGGRRSPTWRWWPSMPVTRRPGRPRSSYCSGRRPMSAGPRWPAGPMPPWPRYCAGGTRCRPVRWRSRWSAMAGRRAARRVSGTRPGC